MIKYQYYIDPKKELEVRIDEDASSGEMIYLSIYNDRIDSSVGCSMDKEQLKGLADFIYDTLQLSIAEKVMVEDSEALRNLSK